MGKVPWLAIALLSVSCSLIRPKMTELDRLTASFNFRNGFALAMQQDSLLARYNRGETITGREVRDLQNNEWVAIAKHLAPGNLILRQWGLIDLFTKTPSNAERILEMADLLSYGPARERLWSEGYSYWGYTRDVLAPWTETFKDDETAKKVKAIMEAVDRGFAVTAYQKDGVWRPAPYGDLRDAPLIKPSLDMRNAMVEPGPRSSAFVKVEPVEGGIKYTVYANPVGMNTHIPEGVKTVEVKDGAPLGFTYYQGYDKKYSSPIDEMMDMTRPGRIGSIKKLKLMERFGD
jgi:hypothetical protein